jgi:hypothetical protein
MLTSRLHRILRWGIVIRPCKKARGRDNLFRLCLPVESFERLGYQPDADNIRGIGRNWVHS